MWIPDAVEGFVEGTVVDLGLDEVTVEPLDRKKGKVTATLDRVYPAEVYDSKDVDDNCECHCHQTSFYFIFIFLNRCGFFRH